MPNFKEYRIGDLFQKENLRWKTGRKFDKRYDLSTEQTIEFDLPLCNAKFGNNGIMYYGRSSDFDYVDCGIDIVNDGAISAGKVYAQPCRVGVLYNAYIITLKHFSASSREVLLYLSTVLEKTIKERFSYENKATWNKVEGIHVKLPTHKVNKPDLSKLAQIIEENGGGVDMSNIDTSTWKTFKIEDLFTAEVGDVDLQQKDINGKGIPFINSGVTDMGVKGLTDRPAKIFPKNTITVDFLGNVYFRDFEYKLATHNHVFSLSMPQKITEPVGMYLQAVLQKICTGYTYSNMCSWNKIKSLAIKLPATEVEEPDWNYMQQYIEELEQQYIEELEQYLIATGLDDYTLTEEDKEVLARYTGGDRV